MEHSILEQQFAELLAGEVSVPLDYEELQQCAKDTLPEDVFEYIAGGAGTEETIRENRRSFARHRIIPRVLRDVSIRDLKVEFLGCKASAPLMLAPIGNQRMVHENGELATARAVQELGIPMSVSYWSSFPLEEIAGESGGGPTLFQLYWPHDWELARSVVRRAEASGYDGIVLTVDSKVPTWRRRNLENGYADRGPMGNLVTDPVVKERANAAGERVEKFVNNSSAVTYDESITWSDLDVLQDWTTLPIFLKGILSTEDAVRAAEWGADGIVVSNHGGRQIDGSVSALDQLPSIQEAVGQDMTLILDSGIRSGADVFKALALGADIAQFGRLYLYGLAVSGQQGVAETALNYLAELESIMGLCGCSTIDDIDASMLDERSYRRNFPSDVD